MKTGLGARSGRRPPADPAIHREPAVREASGGAAHRQHLVMAMAREEEDAVVARRDVGGVLAAMIGAVLDAAVVEAELAPREALRLGEEVIDVGEGARQRLRRAIV